MAKKNSGFWKTPETALAKARRDLGEKWFERFRTVRYSLKYDAAFSEQAATWKKVMQLAEQMEGALDSAARVPELAESIAGAWSHAETNGVQETGAQVKELLGHLRHANAALVRRARALLNRPMGARAGPDVSKARFARKIVALWPSTVGIKPAVWGLFAIGTGLDNPPQDLRGWRSFREAWRTELARAASSTGRVGQTTA